MIKKVSEQTVPKELRNIFVAKPKVAEAWKGLTPIARRDFVTWIEGAKQEETRLRRIEVTSSKLLAGERRPCCYAVVPMNLYKALGANLKAKATWKDLSPDERRDFVAWVDEANNSAMKGIRIEEVCAMLAKGKKQP